MLFIREIRVARGYSPSALKNGISSLLFLLLATLAAAESRPAISTPANVSCEISFDSTRPHSDPFNEITLDVIFVDPQRISRKAPAFWAGGTTWKVRYASPIVGRHSYRTECTDVLDQGLHGVSGTVQVEKYDGDNPLYLHGSIRIAADQRHFEHADGTPFLWIGDTWWMGLCKRLSFSDEFATLTGDRQSKGFNVIQIVAGLYPDQGAFDPRGANEAGFPWEKDYARIRPEYFDAADKRIQFLVEHGMVPCIVGAWGYHLPWLGEKKMEQHLRYVQARWGAMPVVWCVAGEFDLPYYLSPGFPRLDRQQAQGWARVIRDFRKTNVFGRPVTVHPTGIAPLSGRIALRDVAGATDELLDFDMLQTGHGNREVLKPTITTLRASLSVEPPIPVLDGEVSYEALLGRIPADSARLMCWACLLSGAAGHTYGANGIWQLNRPGEPYGKSPHGGTYGPIPWTEAMHLPGSMQIGLAGKLLRQFSFEKFEPHPEWAQMSDPAKNPFLVPYAAGVPERVRVIYVPIEGAIVINALESGVRYTARLFDPVTGNWQPGGNVEPDSSGNWRVADPGWKHDWVVVMQVAQ